MILKPGHDKERVREAVEIAEDMFADALFPRQSAGLPLGATADSARHMQLRRPQRPTGVLS